MPSAAADVPLTFKKSRRFQNEHSLPIAFISYIPRNPAIRSPARQNYIWGISIDADGNKRGPFGQKFVKATKACSLEEFMKIRNQIPSSRFGSITQSFTGLILSQMVVQGQVKLDEPLPELLSRGTVPKPSGPEIR